MKNLKLFEQFNYDPSEEDMEKYNLEKEKEIYNEFSFSKESTDLLIRSGFQIIRGNGKASISNNDYICTLEVFIDDDDNYYIREIKLTIKNKNKKLFKTIFKKKVRSDKHKQDLTVVRNLLTIIKEYNIFV